MFDCRGCRAKDDEIKRLGDELARMHAQLDVALRRAFEVASPGVERRVDPPRPREAREKPQLRRVPTLPGYEPEYEPVRELS
jgi:hypothetical protein